MQCQIARSARYSTKKGANATNYVLNAKDTEMEAYAIKGSFIELNL